MFIGNIQQHTTTAEKWLIHDFIKCTIKYFISIEGFLKMCFK